MSVRIAENAGFCFGVRRATEYVEGLLSDCTARVYILGHLIHNRLYNESLEAKGARHITAAEAEEIAAQTVEGEAARVVIRTHGVGREEEAFLLSLAARYPRFSVEDMTCPFVKKIHRIADESTGEDTVFFLLGTENHPEVQGILSHVRGEKHVFSSARELDELLASLSLDGKRPIFAAQTTQNLAEWKKS